MARNKRGGGKRNTQTRKRAIQRNTRANTARSIRRNAARASAAASVAVSRQRTVARRTTANTGAAVAPRSSEKVTPAKLYDRSDTRLRKRCKDRPENNNKSGKGSYVKTFVPWCEKVKK